MRKVILLEGSYVRIKGNVMIYSPGKKRDGVFKGGSEWLVKNPLIRWGKCKHKPKRLKFISNILNEKIYFKKGKEEVICSNCGQILKLGEKTNGSD